MAEMWNKVSDWLLVVGGLNWLLVGLADVNLVDSLTGGNWVAKVAYIAIGAAAGYKVWRMFK